jgi:hypothetical protein
VRLTTNTTHSLVEEDYNMTKLIKKLDDPDVGQTIAGIALVAMIVYLVIAQ